MRTVEWIYLIFNLLMFVGNRDRETESTFSENGMGGFVISGVLSSSIVWSKDFVGR